MNFLDKKYFYDDGEVKETVEKWLKGGAM